MFIIFNLADRDTCWGERGLWMLQYFKITPRTSFQCNASFHTLKPTRQHTKFIWFLIKWFNILIGFRSRVCYFLSNYEQENNNKFKIKIKQVVKVRKLTIEKMLL